MITSLVGFFNSWLMLINFICHTVVFGSIFYVAIHNREIPRWIITPLWYLAILSGFTACTVVIQWLSGPENPLSYWTLGVLGELSSHIVLAIIASALFLKTLKTDISQIKNRK